ncbi:bifunctional 4-hydroxy-2-oxoglutarate aldolase/2-dehydro-3-deoxy-phosphogluconate aldolase [Nitriliruptor alkaliphilus]|uniref:bifunctional 4-hydroxy-2-oxoglutarate aldolase/2-dehydro-3-deoxy-phosphogluconate aldolase n=1 Tax=Nitriliruptor alkaliphilus TaxID=427918 RepID=UPI0009FB0736|nr:bifunctional 4-hydroxy-2-oxoglutarate aldolase/2-dehydro-3-deoxy-phosphogluconate aldolase [Nitriliruptor alkaliphilus]
MTGTPGRRDVAAQVTSAGVIGIVRERDGERARTVADALLAGGLTVIEITLTTPGATDLIAELADRCAGTDVLVGAGTILDEDAAARAVRAGARFIVSPHLSVAAVHVAHRHGVVAIPGAATVTEAVTAIECGADAVKLFPAGVHGIDWFRSLHAVLPPVPLIPTGGIGPADVGRWLGAGAAAVGLGGQLSRGDAEEVTARVGEVVDCARQVATARLRGDP